MSLQGLPDFDQPIQVEGAQVFYPYEGNGPHLLTPDSLEIAERGDGAPDFRLGVVRGRTPLLPPKPYGILDFRLRARYRIEQSLRLLRERRPNAMLAPIGFRSGFLRLVAGDELTNVPADLLRPAPLAWNSLGITRLVIKLPLVGAMLLKDVLQGQALPLYAIAELEIVGVAPRLPARVSFDPQELLQALCALGNARHEVAQRQLEDYFRQDRQALPLTVSGVISDIQHESFVQALIDRVRQRFGAFVPAPGDDEQPYIALAAPESVGHGRFEWDLAEPEQVSRTLVLRLNPLAAARQLVEREGLEAVFHEAVVPPIATGALTVAISANLPAERAGVLALGVNLYAPSRPPHRPQAATGAAELHPPEDAATVALRLAPGEPPEYRYTTFAVVQDAGGIEQVEGVETPHQGDVLNLTPDDFPLDFIAVEAARALLELASVQVILRRPDGGELVEQTFELSMEHSSAALALPKGTTDATIEVIARERNETGVLTLGPLPAQNLSIDCYAFREYGPQQIEIECVFHTGAQSFAIELQPELGGAPSVLLFRPDQPQRRWTWFAESPFRPGYRYRPFQSREQPSAAWSAPRSPFEPLVIQVGADQEIVHD